MRTCHIITSGYTSESHSALIAAGAVRLKFTIIRARTLRLNTSTRVLRYGRLA